MIPRENAEKSGKHFDQIINQAKEIISKVTCASIVRVTSSADAEKALKSNPDIIIIDGNGSNTVKPMITLLMKLKPLEVLKILLLDRSTEGLDIIKHYVDHIVFEEKEANNLIRTLCMNRK